MDLIDGNRVFVFESESEDAEDPGWFACHPQPSEALEHAVLAAVERFPVASPSLGYRHRCQEYRRHEASAESAEQKLAELTAILGDDPVGRAKALTELKSKVWEFFSADGGRLEWAERRTKAEARELREAAFAEDSLVRRWYRRRIAGALVRLAHRDGENAWELLENALDFEPDEAKTETESLRAALADKDAAYKELDEAYTFALREEGEHDQERDALKAETARLQARVNELVSIDKDKLAAFDAAVAKYGRWPPPPEARFVDGRWEP